VSHCRDIARGVAKLAHSLEAVLRILGERLQDDLVEPLRDRQLSGVEGAFRSVLTWSVSISIGNWKSETSWPVATPVAHLHEAVVDPLASGEDVGWLHVAVDQTMLVRISEGVASLGEQVPDSRDRNRPVFPYQRVEIAPIEVLHDVAERTIVRSAEVVETNGIRRNQCGGGLGLSLETLPRLVDRGRA
jgi:hypothetical protein